MSAILIRAERPSDYHSIAQVNALAFGRAGEAALVDALRHRSDFDPDLSLVALVAGEIVGHALFVPVTLRLAGADVSAVVLSPLAVRPDYQQQGIGGRLLAAGHERARQRGCALALLVGHDSYYPRFGYRTHMYGRVAVRLRREADAVAPAAAADWRAPGVADLPTLEAMWRQWFGDVDLSWAPDAGLCGWLSAGHNVRCQVLEREGRVVGYVRYTQGRPRQPICLLATDGTALEALLSGLAELPAEEGADEEFVLPLHPEAAATRRWLPDAERLVEPWSAAMVLPLDGGQAAVMEYVAGITEGRRTPGLVIWPTEYDVA